MPENENTFLGEKSDYNWLKLSVKLRKRAYSWENGYEVMRGACVCMNVCMGAQQCVCWKYKKLQKKGKWRLNSFVFVLLLLPLPIQFHCWRRRRRGKMVSELDDEEINNCCEKKEENLPKIDELSFQLSGFGWYSSATKQTEAIFHHILVRGCFLPIFLSLTHSNADKFFHSFIIIFFGVIFSF